MQLKFQLKVHKGAHEPSVSLFGDYMRFTRDSHSESYSAEPLRIWSEWTLQVHLLRHLRKLGNLRANFSLFTLAFSRTRQCFVIALN